MRKIEDVRLWRNAVEELNSTRVEITGMEEDVFARLRFSYDHLKNDTIRACFLYCALYPGDREIDVEELIEYWMAEGFIEEVGDREKETNKGYALLNELRYACMVESIDSRWVKMHDLMRDLAIRIRNGSPRFVVKAGVKLKALPREWMEDVERVSIMDSCIELLPDHPNCPNLCTLLLQRNTLSGFIENSFFLHMHSLKVLDLSGSSKIGSLPESVSSLCNLRALFLRFSEVRALPSLAMLKELRVLDLSYCHLETLPQGIDGLVNLRRLDLSYSRLSMFPTGVIQNLSRLDDLSMFKSNWRWSLNRKGISNEADIEEVKSSQLTNLGISFEDLPSFNSYVRSQHWQVLRSYHLGVGQLSNFEGVARGNRSVEIQGCNLLTDGNFIDLPNNIQQLALHGCHDISVLSRLSDTSNFGNLRQCYVSNCSGLKFIETEDGRGNTFRSLELLVLRKLSNLKSIFKGNAAGQTFVRLTTLHIHNCNSLKHILPVGALQGLVNLEEIEVWNSWMVDEIVEESNEVNTTSFQTITVPKLRRLYLSSLPGLRCITKKVLVCTSLNTVDIWDCGKLMGLPFSIDFLPSSLKHIKASRKWWDESEWNEPSCKTCLQPFFDEGV